GIERAVRLEHEEQRLIAMAYDRIPGAVQGNPQLASGLVEGVGPAGTHAPVAACGRCRGSPASRVSLAPDASPAERRAKLVEVLRLAKALRYPGSIHEVIRGAVRSPRVAAPLRQQLGTAYSPQDVGRP
ncbi:MAG: hypothetical protein ACYCR4_14340, partial [Acidimicrobiales bacterium]